MNTRSEQSRLTSLLEQHASKFEEIISFLAQTLPADTDARATAQVALEQWEALDADSLLPLPADMTPYQRLLNEHYELGNQILDIHDEAIERRHAGEHA
jgi:hypothetical protein